jgi:hypothetical protein
MAYICLTIRVFQWKIVSGSACPNICDSIGGNWRRETLAAIQRHEDGVGMQAQLLKTASAKLAEMQSLKSQKQAELESLRVCLFFCSFNAVADVQRSGDTS